MRNATANFDDDLGFEPARKAPRKRAKSRTTPKGKGKRRPTFNAGKIGRYAILGIAGCVVAGIMVNALVMQKSRHPAPLFGKTVQLGVPPAPVPRPAATVAPTTTTLEEHADIPTPIAKPHYASVLPGTPDKPSDSDAIAKLLQTPGSAGAKAGDKTEQKTVIGVQRALVKLGFDLKPNGSFGPATRKAIETFQKDRHLPIKAELTTRLVKIISAESGIKID